MLPENRMALKEWAVVVKALQEGRQIVLLRKGGIAEEGGEFRVDHPEFVFYPTYVHQQREHVRPEFHGDFAAVDLAPWTVERIPLDTSAVVEEVVEAADQARLHKLTGHHIWTPGYVDMRFHYRPGTPLYLMLLRVHRLPRAVEVVETPEYRGCKSWVTLEAPVATSGATPVLSDAAFAQRVAAVKAILKAD
ncbi:MAG: DUF1802 family protein [Candidatus Methylomirabilales bacterium]